jgi:hypothetical protein
MEEVAERINVFFGTNILIRERVVTDRKGYIQKVSVDIINAHQLGKDFPEQIACTSVSELEKKVANPLMEMQELAALAQKPLWLRNSFSAQSRGELS